MKKSTAQRYVNMWAFLGMHPTNIDILQRLKSADDRQFGTNMDVCGSISDFNERENSWDDSHIAGIRSDIWNPDKGELEKTLRSLHSRRKDRIRRTIRKQGRLNERQEEELKSRLHADEVLSLSEDDIEKRRLVMKTFKTTGQRIRWGGTIEEVTTREVHNSIGSNRTVLSLVAILPGYEYLTLIQQNHRTFRVPAIYTLCFYDESTSRTWYINIKRKWVSIGADFAVESEGRQIGEIDGKLIGFGYNAYVTITEPSLANNGTLLDLLTLFATSVGYHRAMRRSVRRRVAAVKRGETARHVIEDEEFWLLKNPRRHAA